jgi:diguanylate cyclase (GGDEF)-like protein
MESINLSLAERMRIDDLEIARRKELLEFTQADVDILASAKPVIIEALDAVVDEFYLKQTSIDEIRLIIGDSETLRRLRSAQSGYIAELFSGYYDLEYVNNRLRIGLVHKRIGVEPKYYLSAVKVLKDILTNVIQRNICDAGTVIETLNALDKLLNFDTQLVFDTYIGSMLSEIEAAKDKALRYARNLEDKVSERTEELAKLSRVDSLTGLLNTRALIEEGRLLVARSRRAGAALSLVYLDVNGFKTINDSFGHFRGDETLKSIGTAVSEIVRETDLASRYGGDEFCIILPSTDQDGAEAFCDRLAKKIRESANVSVSIGIATTGPNSHESLGELVQRADKHMYAMKAQQRSHMPDPDDTFTEVREALSESFPKISSSG